jgi:hypothetical protein
MAQTIYTYVSKCKNDKIKNNNSTRVDYELGIIWRILLMLFNFHNDVLR